MFKIILIFSLNSIILTQVFGASIIADEKLRNLEKAKEILDKYPLIDGHNDLPHMIRTNFMNRFGQFDLNDMKQSLISSTGKEGITHTDIKRIREGKLSGQFWAIYANCQTDAKDSVRRHLEQIDVVYRFVEKYSNDFQFVQKSGDIMPAFKNKKIISLLGLESGHAIDSSLAILRVFYELGVRYMTLTHNCDVPWATNNQIDRLANASSYGGLTKFGRKVIQEMNRLGMIVDLSHVSYQTMLDALDESKAPVMFSHSSVYSLCNHVRNVRDDVLLKLKQNNGILMINLYNGFIKCGNQVPTMNDIIAHFNYTKNLIGVDHIGIGADFDGVDLTPPDVDDVSKYPNLFAALIENGWNENDLAKIAGLNVIRVLADNEKYAKSVENMEPIDDYIDKTDLDPKYSECRTSF
ncbi:unnamed protein product [Brachionus calyciflorus]|uniref:Dipeptidase n=1 Tax=Brachionus calyciflorus TaxID=104777 RepID=A0A813RMC6_9BILA|nr:unnamed protein product [Brachionus calyciflorus]